MRKKVEQRAVTSASTSRRQIFIRNLVLPMTIGFYGHEKGRLQPVQINLCLTVSDTPIRDGDLGSVVDYVSVVDKIRKLSLRKNIKLAETLAEHVIDICLKDRRVVSARVRVEKPHAISDAEAAGVEVERSVSRPTELRG